MVWNVYGKCNMKQKELLEAFNESIKGIQKQGGKIIAQYGEPQGGKYYRVGLIIKREKNEKRI